MLLNQCIAVAIVLFNVIGIYVSCKESSIMRSNREFIHMIAYSQAVKLYIVVLLLCLGTLIGFWLFLIVQLWSHTRIDLALILINIGVAIAVGSLSSMIYCIKCVRE